MLEILGNFHVFLERADVMYFHISRPEVRRICFLLWTDTKIHDHFHLFLCNKELIESKEEWRVPWTFMQHWSNYTYIGISKCFSQWSADIQIRGSFRVFLGSSDAAPIKGTQKFPNTFYFMQHRRPQCQYHEVTINIVTPVKYLIGK